MARIPANTRHWHNVCSTLAHRLRRWPNIDKTLGQCLMLAGMWHNVAVQLTGVTWKVHTFLEGAQRLTHKITSLITLLHTCAVIACKSESLKRDIVCQIDLMLGQRLRRWSSINPAWIIVMIVFVTDRVFQPYEGVSRKLLHKFIHVLLLFIIGLLYPIKMIW